MNNISQKNAEGMLSRHKHKKINKDLARHERIYFYAVQKASMFLFEKLCQGQVEGVSNLLALKKGALIVCNHSSYLDWLVLFSEFKNRYGKEIVFLAKEKLFKSIIWKKLIKAAKCIKVTNDGVSKSEARKIIKMLNSGGIVGIFPEGTRSNSGELQEAKAGMVQLAAMANAPIVPVGLIGFYDVLPRHKIIPRPGKCKIIIGEPIFTEKLRNEGFDENQMTRIVMQEISRMIDKPYNY